jgi:hypothetical protein
MLNKKHIAYKVASEFLIRKSFYNDPLSTLTTQFLTSHQTALEKGIESTSRTISYNPTDRELRSIFKQLHKDITQSKKENANLRRAIANRDIRTIEDIIDSFNVKMEQIEKFGNPRQVQFSNKLLKDIKQSFAKFNKAAPKKQKSWW